MDIDEMTDTEKSVLLAQVMGGDKDTYPMWTLDFKKSRILGGSNNLTPADYVFDLYGPSNMALAWRVLNWAHKQFPGHGINPITKMYQGFHEAVFLPADKVVATWLDETLYILIEAGITNPEVAKDPPHPPE